MIVFDLNYEKQNPAFFKGVRPPEKYDKPLCMSEDQQIIFACCLDGAGGATPLEGTAVSEKIKADDLAWVHMNAGHPATRSWLQREVSYLDAIIVDALLADETRPRILEIENGVMMILRGVNLNENAEPEDMVSIRIWIDPNRIISLRRRKLKAAQDLREALEQGKGPTGPGDFLVSLTARLFERMEPVLTDLDERLDEIEEKVLDETDVEQRQEINDIRRQAIIMRRYIAPQRDAIMHLRSSDITWLEPVHKRKLQESLDRLTRYVEDLDMIRERAQIVKEELVALHADKLNKNLYVLSIVAAIFLPLGFLTGLLGINVGGMPGVDSNLAFWAVCALCVSVLGLQLALFRWLKWI